MARKELATNRLHPRAFVALKDLLGKRPLVPDREFGDLALLQFFRQEGLH